jgi:two-component system, OmpR family, phosphate regulon sensor histidine kinase PhoR
MRVRRSRSLVTMYVLSLGATMALLVVWVVYVVRSASRLSDLGQRVGLNWLLLTVGCVLLFFLIVGLTYQLAQALAARRYVLKQDEFVANITHEMKSPLAAIKLHAQTLQQGDVGFDKSRSFLATIEQQADRAAALVDAVLESSRLQARKHRLELVPVELAPFWDAYFAAARPRVESRGVTLRAEATGAGTVMGSEEALRRMLDNLIDNAVRFSKPGGEVRCRLSTRPGFARIDVEDDGVGIPKGELLRIFDRFYQARRQSEPHRQGSGLGLSIVAGLAAEMRGTVRAHSQEDRPGTLFVIELPLAGEPVGESAGASR